MNPLFLNNNSWCYTFPVQIIVWCLFPDCTLSETKLTWGRGLECCHWITSYLWEEHEGSREIHILKNTGLSNFLPWHCRVYHDSKYSKLELTKVFTGRDWWDPLPLHKYSSVAEGQLNFKWGDFGLQLGFTPKRYTYQNMESMLVLVSSNIIWDL